MVKSKLKTVLIVESLDDVLISKLGTIGVKADIKLNLPFPDLIAQVKNYDTLIVGSKFLANAQFLNSVSQLKLLIVIGNRLDNVDLDEANSKNIAVTSVPNYQIVAIAEYMCLLLLALARPIVQSCVKLKTGIWDREAARGIELFGKSVALIGNFHICFEIAKRILPLGVRILYSHETVKAVSSPTSSNGQVNTATISIPTSATATATSTTTTPITSTSGPTTAVSTPIVLPTLTTFTATNDHLNVCKSITSESLSLFGTQVPLEELWANADLLCFQMNTDKTKSLLTVDCLRKLKRGARLICFGLPSSCSESDLLEALNSGQIAAMALDLDEVTAGRSRKLIEHPNVICTPSLCDATLESQMRLSNALVQQIQCVIQGKVPTECVNPQVWNELFSAS